MARLLDRFLLEVGGDSGRGAYDEHEHGKTGQDFESE